MSKPTPLNWPDDYRNWSGTIKELADTAADVLRTLEPDVKSPNIRLLRYYQQSGVMGRGKKRGGQAIFGFKDLERVVSAKGLVKKNWTLEQAVSLMDSSPSPVSFLLYADPSRSPATPRGAVDLPLSVKSGDDDCSPAPSGASQSAQDVVARLMAKSGTLSHAPQAWSPASTASVNTASVSSAHGLVFPSFSPKGVLQTDSSRNDSATFPPSKPLLGVQAAPWMAVYLDEAAARRASSADREAAIQALISALRSLS